MPATAIAVLLIPAVLALLLLFISRWLYPNPQDLETDHPHHLASEDVKLPRGFWLYTAFTAASIAGFTHFQLISYHLKAQGVVPYAQIPILFAVVMGVDALVALPVGRFFDKKGLLTLMALPLLTLPIPFLVFSRVTCRPCSE